MTAMVIEVAATWGALGLDPEKVVFYRQSAVPEILELSWLFACPTAKGLLNRGHAYKAAVERNLSLYGDPDAEIHDAVKTVPGLDGRKMSKSYGNDIPILCEPEELRRRVMRIKTDSRRPEEPKDTEQCNVFALNRHFAPLADVSKKRDRYISGGVAYKEVIEALHAVLKVRFATARERYLDLVAAPRTVFQQLENGGAKAREAAQQVLARVRQAAGTGGSLDYRE